MSFKNPEQDIKEFAELFGLEVMFQSSTPNSDEYAYVVFMKRYEDGHHALVEVMNDNAGKAQSPVFEKWISGMYKFESLEKGIQLMTKREACEYALEFLSGAKLSAPDGKQLHAIYAEVPEFKSMSELKLKLAVQKG